MQPFPNAELRLPVGGARNFPWDTPVAEKLLRRTGPLLKETMKKTARSLVHMAALVTVACLPSVGQQAPPSVSISISPATITAGQTATLTWSAKGATSCQGGGDPFIANWTSAQQASSGQQTIRQEPPGAYVNYAYGSAGTYVYVLTCTGNGSTSASATLVVINPGSPPVVTEAITSLPADITPLLSMAGIWQPVANQYLRPGEDNGNIVGPFLGNVRLVNGREGLIATGWSCCGAPTSAPITPVNIAILEQQADGTLQLATAKYVSDPQTNGATNVLVADFNGDGIPDFFLPAYNESPFLPASSTAYMSTSDGTYARLPVADAVEAHGGTVANIGAGPFVFAVGYGANCTGCGIPNAYRWSGADFAVTPMTGILGCSSTAVGDLYGDGTYAAIYGDYAWPLPDPNYVQGIYVYKLAGVYPAGEPLSVGDPYFNDKLEYASYRSATDPHGKTHNYRLWLDDFNHDSMQDIVVHGSIWNPSQGALKNVLQMFQNVGGYQFKDVTDALDPLYDKNGPETDYVPQVRDIDGSGINSYLLGGSSNSTSQAASNYLIVGDGSGNLVPALHETLNRYGQQAVAWLTSLSSFNSSFFLSAPQPAIRAYRTADGMLNFVAVVWTRTPVENPSLEQYAVVNLPLRLDLPRQLTKPMVVRNRNGSHLIRTFAGDDTIYSGNSGGYSKVDGGLGTNTVVYSGPSKNYSASRNGDGSWTVKDNVGGDGTDTLIRIQRLQFADTVVRLDGAAGPANAPVISAVVNGASYQPRIVPGSWVTIQGQNLSGVTRTWSAADFTNGPALPTNLSGVQVTFNGEPAAIYYVSPTQLNVQAPANLSGSVSVQAQYFGRSNSFSVTATQSAPGLFTYQGGSNFYPAAVYNGTSTLVGDPAVSGGGVRKAQPGDVILLYATGIEPSPAGAALSAPLAVQSPIIVTIGSQSATVLGAALVYPGEFQINIVVPDVPNGDNLLKLSVGSQPSQSGVIIPIAQ